MSTRYSRVDVPLLEVGTVGGWQFKHITTCMKIGLLAAPVIEVNITCMSFPMTTSAPVLNLRNLRSEQSSIGLSPISLNVLKIRLRPGFLV